MSDSYKTPYTPRIEIVRKRSLWLFMLSQIFHISYRPRYITCHKSSPDKAPIIKGDKFLVLKVQNNTENDFVMHLLMAVIVQVYIYPKIIYSISRFQFCIDLLMINSQEDISNAQRFIINMVCTLLVILIMKILDD